MLHGCHVCQKASDIFSDEKFGLPELYILTRKSLCSEFWSGLIFYGISRSPKSYGFCDLKIWDLNSERFVKRISSKSIKSVFFFVSVTRIGLGLVVGLGLAQFTDFGST